MTQRSQPTVTVVMPTHNRAHLLGRAIRSVIAQTWTHWELIVVDDGSRDATSEIVAGFADPRIRYMRNETPLGPAGARNTGIAAAGPTEFLSFLDDDDEWLPRKLELQLEVFRNAHPNVVAVGCGRIAIDDKTEEVHVPTHRGYVFEHLLARRAKGFGAQMILVRRQQGEADLLFDREIQPLEDLDFSIRQALRGDFDFTPEPLVRVFNDFEGPHVWNAATAVTGYGALARKYHRELSREPSILTYYDACIAMNLWRLRRMSECRALLAKAATRGPERPRLLFWLAASVIGPLGLRVANRLAPILPPPAAVEKETGMRSRRSLGLSLWMASSMDFDVVMSFTVMCGGLMA